MFSACSYIQRIILKCLQHYYYYYYFIIINTVVVVVKPGYFLSFIETVWKEAFLRSAVSALKPVKFKGNYFQFTQDAYFSNFTHLQYTLTPILYLYQ
jgi:hypothetical protein